MIGDLHLHTRHSDGSRWPREALVAAKQRGLDFVSFVDHDTTAGTAQSMAIGLRLGITAIPGVEISAWDPERGRKVHILGYNYRLPATNIEALVTPLREARDANTRRQIEEIIAAGYQITTEAVIAHATGPEELARAATDHESVPTLYKQHVMLALIDAGYTDAIYSPLYRELFKGAGVASHDIQYVGARDAVRAIRADGGKPVLAHPAQLDSWEIIPELVEAGLLGIELYHGDQSKADQARTRAVAREHGLFMTGGSDDHGAYGGGQSMGDICAPSEAFAAIIRPNDTDVAWAVELVRAAGHLAREAVAEEADVALKGGDIKDLVTQHDIAIDHFLTGAIRERYPEHGFLTEEQDHPEIASDQPYWIIDPIDGTTNFVTRRDYFAISVGHYRGDEGIFGIVYDVMQDELYLGIAGEGAWLNGVPMPRLGPDRPLNECVIECSLNASFELADRYGADSGELARRFRATRSSGSAAIGICRVARDTLDIYLSSSLAIWDYAAAVIILKEVGGDWTRPTLRPKHQTDQSPSSVAETDWLNNGRRPFLAAHDRAALAGVQSVLFPKP